MDHAYKTIELTGSSTETVEDAINQAIARSNETIDKLRWFEVEQIRGHIENGSVGLFQVTLKVGFSLDES
ncbi:MAG: dodecin family protein [Pseudomonadaceae bacterium]|nr:dodecin family protein [Pseudomonadaceae bacterium]